MLKKHPSSIHDMLCAQALIIGGLVYYMRIASENPIAITMHATVPNSNRFTLIGYVLPKKKAFRVTITQHGLNWESVIKFSDVELIGEKEPKQVGTNV